jgi:molybdopterin-guanine dinucleotide biosynthesis protein A
MLYFWAFDRQTRPRVAYVTSTALSVEICILAGGLSRRMRRNKSRLRLGGRTMLGHIRATAKSLGFPVRVIRRDVVTRCGPLGGIYTALKTTRADVVMFLACDMPFITAALLRALLRRFDQQGKALFVYSEEKTGFPIVLRREALAMVARQIEAENFALHELSRTLKAMRFAPPVSNRAQLRNINTPQEWARAVASWNRKSVKPDA